MGVYMFVRVGVGEQLEGERGGEEEGERKLM